jgi:hypothetical protein
MKINNDIRVQIKRKFVTALFIIASLATFAALGDGKDGGKTTHHKSLLSAKKTPYDFKNFSLKSRYNFRGNTILSLSQDRYLTLNTIATYQKGNTTYILPMKKKVLLEKIKFNPAQ